MTTPINWTAAISRVIESVIEVVQIFVDRMNHHCQAAEKNTHTGDEEDVGHSGSTS
jgi:hypothetical protein